MINILLILITTFLIETLTIFGRFVFKISSKNFYIHLTKKLKLKYIIHIHHLFLGIIISIISYYYNLTTFFNLGLAMVLSDLIHHFIILQYIIGNPEFHIIYKNSKQPQKEESRENRKIKKFLQHLIHTL